MMTLRKLHQRIPSVLIAVLVTTLIAWLTGFERNETVTLRQIESDRVHVLVEDYNGTLREIETTMEEKVEVAARFRAESRAHGNHSLEAIELHAEESRLEVRAERLNRKAGVLRADLRDFRFLRLVEEGGPIRFVLPGSEPATEERGGAPWRLEIGRHALDPDSLAMMGGGAVVGVIPRGLPHFRAPRVDLGTLLHLFPMAAIISLLGFMEAISIAKAMAARSGQRLDPNQELIGQGLSNLVGSFSQSYPVSGSFSRSAVNFQAGAATGISNAFSTLVVLVTLLFLTPLLYYLPQSVLAAIIMMAVIGLLNISGFVHAWKAQRYDGMISVISFVATLGFAPHLDRGILLGVLLSLALYLYRNMKPEMAILSRSPEGDFQDAERWRLERCRHVAVMRFGGSLFFANVNYLEDVVLRTVAEMPELKHILIVGNGINELDSSGEVLLSQLVTRLRERELEISFAGLNDSVLDVMQRTHLLEKIGTERFFSNVTQAVREIHAGVCLGSTDHQCPLLHPKFTGHELDEKLRKRLEARRKWPRREG